MTQLHRLSLLLAVLLLYPACGEPEKDQAPRGIILISADTLGAGHLGLYGYGPDTSPNIDRWAEEAVVFRNAFAQLPGTLPSHMSMMTGLTPGKHGVYPSQKMPVALADDIPTLAEKLQRAGYATAGFTEGGYVAGVYGFNRGFDQWDDRFATWPNVLNAADAFLGTLEPDAPFFLFLHTYDIHDPYAPPTAYRELFSPPPGPLSIAPKGKELVEVNRGLRSVTPGDVEQLRALYDGGIRLFDHQWQLLLTMLDHHGLQNRTLVILTADHGEEFMEHGRLAHETVYNPGIHVPLVIRPSERPARGEIQAMVQLTDLPATILAWAGLPPMASGGTDLLALAATETEPERSFAYSESYVDPYRVLAGRVAGRRAKLMVRRPRVTDRPAVCDRVCGLLAPGEKVTFAMRSEGPTLQVSLLREGKPGRGWEVGGQWTKQTLRTGGDALLFCITGGDGETRPLRIRALTPGTRVFPGIRLYDLDADPDEQRNVVSDEPALTRELLRELGRRLDEDRQISKPQPVIYNEDQRQRLQALGYLE